MMTDLRSDTRSLMLFEAQKKSAGITYLLWFFCGVLGVHRFYAGATISGLFMLGLAFFGLVFAAQGGLVLWAVLLFVVFVDAFGIPGMIRDHNIALANKLIGPPAPVHNRQTPPPLPRKVG